jgi:hypothetical protein
MAWPEDQSHEDKQAAYTPRAYPPAQYRDAWSRIDGFNEGVDRGVSHVASGVNFVIKSVKSFVVTAVVVAAFIGGFFGGFGLKAAGANGWWGVGYAALVGLVFSVVLGFNTTYLGVV